VVKVLYFSKGKIEERNEDCFGYNDTCFAIADGATDKSGRKYDGKTGGELASRMVTDECQSSGLNGIEMVAHLNEKIAKLYRKLGILGDITDPKYRFTCGFVCVRVKDGKIIITYLGDLGFRINGDKAYREIKQVDIDNSDERARYIRATGNVPGSRNHVNPLVLKQYEYQNNENATLGYGVIDGTKTPNKFVKTFQYNLDEIKTIELFTDGYFLVPKVVSIGAWEEAHQRVETEDPDKWKKYKSTKSRDDRTVAIIEF
jgi:serine/threonine protein phosphatase PrpC